MKHCAYLSRICTIVFINEDDQHINIIIITLDALSIFFKLDIFFEDKVFQ